MRLFDSLQSHDGRQSDLGSTLAQTARLHTLQLDEYLLTPVTSWEFSPQIWERTSTSEQPARRHMAQDLDLKIPSNDSSIAKHSRVANVIWNSGSLWNYILAAVVAEEVKGSSCIPGVFISWHLKLTETASVIQDFPRAGWSGVVDEENFSARLRSQDHERKPTPEIREKTESASERDYSRVSRNDVNLQLVITAPTYPTQGVPFTSHVALLGAATPRNPRFIGIPIFPIVSLARGGGRPLMSKQTTPLVGRIPAAGLIWLVGVAPLGQANVFVYAYRTQAKRQSNLAVSVAGHGGRAGSSLANLTATSHITHHTHFMAAETPRLKQHRALQGCGTREFSSRGPRESVGGRLPTKDYNPRAERAQRGNVNRVPRSRNTPQRSTRPPEAVRNKGKE
ncbi:uncharacterized protein CLUP02_16621 [Colletotrichum lupini]|uniref:Uncharacterized protein n=1 Tax=Colletotrichum lupini TaxID=145971 RepID=A0A9Q8WQ56_9PEZI|nr:uncharacterized protein CLUP02_16621 [Colletotrichum lupini]UQC91087.1 hypothetical protein CLUP02_16621 [Colletotrichum lupini]